MEVFALMAAAASAGIAAALALGEAPRLGGAIVLAGQGAAAQGVGGTCPPGVNPGRPGSVAPAWVGLGGEKGQGLRCPRRGHARRGPGSGAPAAGRACLRDVLGAAVLVDRRGCCGNAGRGFGTWGVGGAREVGSVEGACAGDARRLQDAFGCHGLGPDACAGGRVRGDPRARPGRGAVRRLSLRLRCGLGTEEALGLLAAELEAPGVELARDRPGRLAQDG